MLTRALNLTRAWGPTVLILWFVAAGVASAWLLGLKWVSIATSLFFLCLVVLIAHVWGQVEAAVSKGTEDTGPRV